MPKKPPLHNPRNRNPRTVQSAASVLQRIKTGSAVVVAANGTDAVAICRLCDQLPESLRARVAGSIEKEDELVLLAESAAWAARLKLALAEVPRDDPRKVTVRVLPRATTRRMDRYDPAHSPRGGLPDAPTDPLAAAGPVPGNPVRSRRRG